MAAVSGARLGGLRSDEAASRNPRVVSFGSDDGRQRWRLRTGISRVSRRVAERRSPSQPPPVHLPGLRGLSPEPGQFASQGESPRQDDSHDRPAHLRCSEGSCDVGAARDLDARARRRGGEQDPHERPDAVELISAQDLARVAGALAVEKQLQGCSRAKRGRSSAASISCPSSVGGGGCGNGGVCRGFEARLRRSSTRAGRQGVAVLNPQGWRDIAVVDPRGAGLLRLSRGGDVGGDPLPLSCGDVGSAGSRPSAEAGAAQRAERGARLRSGDETRLRRSSTRGCARVPATVNARVRAAVRSSGHSDGAGVSSLLTPRVGVRSFGDRRDRPEREPQPSDRAPGLGRPGLQWRVAVRRPRCFT